MSARSAHTHHHPRPRRRFRVTWTVYSREIDTPAAPWRFEQRFATGGRARSLAASIAQGGKVATIRKGRES